ncbi:hypothetical protein PTTW11_03486 [Pyrenophora teres f. teres]|uniref:Rhodopsin domain-containing protein n=1 Tax=Pyrenophora teres f. teres TaxID=97479 RepID=A0A6S6VWW1_9PLEO|nr:hypothetical protein PTTW11_03486 [Pyrenophora teres f. teres]
MTAAQQEDWPNRKMEILAPTTTLCVISTLFFIWRVAYGIKSKRRILIYDYLLTVAAVLNIASIVVRYKTCQHGLGRHIKDPSIHEPYDTLLYSYYLWIGKIINMLAVAFLKYSICAYLLALRFSKVYLGVVWVSIVMVTILNLTIPMMRVFCRTPFEANWNPKMPGRCLIPWTGVPEMPWTQGAANIITDIVYVVAPIIYLNTIQLSQRTRWGLRIVFLLGLVRPSYQLKTTELPALSKTHDPTWDSTRLVIWSGIELSVGILIASLPPLRKQFEALLQRNLPFSFLKSTRNRGYDGQSIQQLWDDMKPPTVGSGSRRKRALDDEEDGESQRYMLQELPSKGEITKTIVHEIRSDDRSSVQMPERTYSVYK